MKKEENKMKKIKKLIVATLSAVLLGTSVITGFGCGGSSDDSTSTDLEINYWQSGYGIEFLENAIAKFKQKYPQYNVTLNSSPNQSTVTASLGLEGTDTVDLYITGAIDSQLMEYAEPLNDILSSKADSGESKTIGEKMYPEVMSSYKQLDNNYYNLPFAGSMGGIVYNTTIIDGENYTVPRTTDELEALCGELTSNRITPFTHFNEGYWFLLYPVFQAQYDGIDYYNNTFLTLGNQDLSTKTNQDKAKEILMKKDGRYESIKALEKIISKENVLSGSNGSDFSTAQTKFMNGYCAMMVNGGWLLNEMKADPSKKNNFSMMKTPIVSSIVNKCSQDLKSESELLAVIDAIDYAIDNGVSVNDISLTGTGYSVQKSDIEKIYEARTTMMSLYNGSVFTVPSYAKGKEAAKEFIKYYYSDENIKDFVSALHLTLPFNLSTGESISTEGWCNFEIEQLNFVKTSKPIYIYNYCTSANGIFTVAGARPFEFMKDGRDFPYVFASNTTENYTSADDVWGYMTYVWEKEWTNYLRDAGFLY